MRQIDRITTYVAAFGVLLSVAAFFVSTEVGIGALSGAAIAIGDWLVTRLLGRRLLAAGDSGRTILSLTLVGKMTAVLLACALVLASGRVSALGFLIGISAMVLGVVFGGLADARAPSATAAGDVQPSETK